MTSRRAAVLILAGAAALAGSYPPLRLPILSFVALVPAVLLVRQAAAQGDPRRAFQWGWWYGVAANGVVLYWMVIALWHYTPFSALGYLITVAILACLTGGLFWLLVRLRRRVPVVPLWVTLPVAWTALEWLVGHLSDIRFPWLGLGTSLADAPVLVQWADLAGARGVTLWLAWANVLIAEAAVTWSSGKRETGNGKRDRGMGKGERGKVVAVAATIVLALAYGVWRMRTVPVREAGVVGLIQPNEGFREKWEAAHADSVVGKLVGMTRQVVAASHPDLIIWPEAALPGYVVVQPDWNAVIGRSAREARAPIFTGGLHVDTQADGSSDRPPYYNAAFFFDTTGLWQPYAVYAKHYLVPVVERVPFFPVRWFRRIPGLQRWSGGFSAGRALPVYDSPVGRFGVVICYESAFEDLPRRYRRQGAEFLVNITNDAWFGRTSAPAQHASHLVLRAIETRMGVARAANSGISEFVDPLGRAYAATRLDTDAVVADTLRTSDVRTLYVRLGDWVGTLVVVTTLGFVLVLVLPVSRLPFPVARP
ncbi:MAG: apolipoprotein N-acyltransferase [Candidatus Rokuibacteriota bacterium]